MEQLIVWIVDSSVLEPPLRHRVGLQFKLQGNILM